MGCFVNINVEDDSGLRTSGEIAYELKGRPQGSALIYDRIHRLMGGSEPPTTSTARESVDTTSAFLPALPAPPSPAERRTKRPVDALAGMKHGAAFAVFNPEGLARATDR